MLGQADLANAQESKAEILSIVRRTCDGVSSLAVNGNRAKIEVKEGLQVETTADNSVEIKKDGVLLEKIDNYTASDRQKCIDSLLSFLNPQANDDNPLIRAARGNGLDYRDFLKDIKIEIEGIYRNASADASDFPSLVFLFANKSPLEITIYSGNGCELVNWNYKYGIETKVLNNTFSLNQLGVHGVKLPSGDVEKIAYELNYPGPLSYGSEKRNSSFCEFYISFEGQAIAYDIKASANIPIKQN